MGLGRGALEPQTHRLRPEGLSLNATFGGTVNNAGYQSHSFVSSSHNSMKALSTSVTEIIPASLSPSMTGSEATR